MEFQIPCRSSYPSWYCKTKLKQEVRGVAMTLTDQDGKTNDVIVITGMMIPDDEKLKKAFQKARASSLIFNVYDKERAEGEILVKNNKEIDRMTYSSCNFVNPEAYFKRSERYSEGDWFRCTSKGRAVNV